MVYNSIDEIIGNTPLLRLKNLKEEKEANIFMKLEYLNPSSSIKDRAALYMINAAEQEGILKKGGTIVEPTSGNTGIGLAMIGASRGYKVILVMPETMSLERRKLIKAFGAEIILTPASEGMEGSVNKAKKLAKEKGYYFPDQFGNKNNKRAHYETTALEILNDVDYKIDAFVAGIGTSGTLIGVAKRLKEYNKDILIVGVEPSSSRVIETGKSGSHDIQGIGANFVPSLYDKNLVDKIIPISTEEAYRFSRLLGRKEGILAGISSGANIAASKKISKELGENKTIVTVLPDTGERYLSTELYNGE